MKKAVEWFRTPPLSTKPRTHTKFIYDPGITNDEHINLWLKTFILTLELNPQS